MEIYKKIKNKITIDKIKSYLKEIKSIKSCGDLQYSYYTTRFNFGLIQQELKKIDKSVLNKDQIITIEKFTEETKSEKERLSKCSVWD